MINFLKVKLIEENKIENSLILFPETFFSEGVQINSYYYNELSNKIRDLNSKHKNEIFSGIELYEVLYDSTELKEFSNKIGDNRWINIYNSAIYFNDKTDYYHKSKLVVGVEKMPYRNILEPILGQVLLDFGGLSLTRGFQNRRHAFKSSNYNISPIICYESIYGEYLTDYVKDGGKVLAIITNDAWWDYTEGHRQHFSYAKLRAIETRKNVIRSANTGISGIIDSKGDEIIKTEITAVVRRVIGPIAKPDKIQIVSGLPKTRSGKIMRRILRKVASNDFDNLGDTSTLLNPDVVDEIIKGSSN